MTTSHRAGRAVPQPWRMTLTGEAAVLTERESTAVLRAVRALSEACRAERRALPILPVVLADGNTVEAHLAAPSGRAPQPWRTAGHVWRVDVARLPEVGALDAYPALVALGRLDDRAVLVDLGAAPGLVEVHGPEREVRDVLASLAAGVRSAPWSSAVGVSVLGDVPATGRRVDALDDALPRGVPDLGGVHGRWGPVARGRHEVVLCGRPLEAAERALVRRTSRLRNAPTVVAAGEPGNEHGVWCWHVEAGVLTW